jgi:hypothetical protein
VAAEAHVRFNYADFSLEQAVGAIKARVQERGGEIKPLTPTRKAELLRAEEAISPGQIQPSLIGDRDLQAGRSSLCRNSEAV